MPRKLLIFWNLPLNNISYRKFSKCKKKSILDTCKFARNPWKKIIRRNALENYNCKLGFNNFSFYLHINMDKTRVEKNNHERKKTSRYQEKN